MAKTDLLNPPLVAIDDRNASDSLGGYVYQVWQTLLQWFELKDDEALWLERDEDFSVTQPDSAVATQVKRTGRNVTLNSQGPRDAINNYWRHKNANPGRRVALIFLTTAERGLEKGRPFAPVSGMEYWARCAATREPVAPLRTFLRGLAGLDAQLLEFLRTATDDDIASQFLTRITWSTGAPSIDGTRALVEERASRLGRSFGQLPADSVAALPALFQFVVDAIVSNSPVPLNMERLAIAFDSAIRVPVTPSELRARSSSPAVAFEAVASLFGTGAPEAHTFGESGVGYPPAPPIPPGCSMRAALVDQLATRLQSQGSLWLIGSSGMGKSILATLVTQRLADVVWFRLRGISGTDLRRALFVASRCMTTVPRGTTVVLDDVAADISVGSLRFAFDGIRDLAQRYGLRLVVTAQGEPPADVAGPEERFVVPGLALSEVREVLNALGCGSDELGEWSLIAKAASSGHPQLVHARALRLKAEGWPSPSMKDLVAADDLEQVRREARLRLRQEIPNEDADRLAAKVSVFLVPFKREHAIRLCSAEPAVANPGAVIDRLIGPWIELAGDQRLTVSPLLRDAAVANWGLDRVRELHRAAANAFLRDSTLDLEDVRGGLLHAVLGREAFALLRVVGSLLSRGLRNHPDLAGLIKAEVRIASIAARAEFADNAEARALLELLWLKCECDDGDADGSKEAVDALRGTLTVIDAPVGVHIRASMNTILVSQPVVPLTPGDFVAAAAELFSLPHELGEAVRAVPLLARLRYRDPESVVQFFEAIEGLPATSRERFIESFKSDAEIASLTVYAAWLGETRLPEPRWGTVLASLRRIGELGAAWGCGEITMPALRAECVVMDEHLGDAKGALDRIDGLRRAHTNHPLLDLAEAVIHFRGGDFKRTLEIGLPLAESLTSGFERLFLIAKLLDAAWKSDLVETALQLTAQGEGEARALDKADLALGFSAERALIQWIRGQRGAGGSALIAVALEADQLDAARGHPSRVTALVRSTIAWMSNQASTTPQTVRIAPFPGMFVSGEKLTPEVAQQLAAHPRAFFWSLAARLERQLGQFGPAADRLRLIASADRHPVALYESSMIDWLGCYRSKHFTSLVSTYAKSLEFDVETARRLFEGEYRAPEESLLRERRRNSTGVLVQEFACALVVDFFDNHAIRNDLIRTWTSEARALHFDAALITALEELANAAHEGRAAELRSALGNSRPWAIRGIAAVLMCLSNKGSLLDSAVAGALGTSFLHSSVHRGSVARAWSSVVSDHWRMAAETRRFELVAPSVNAPLILAACSSERHGFNRAAEVLEAAAHATGAAFRLGSILSDLRGLRDDSTANDDPLPI